MTVFAAVKPTAGCEEIEALGTVAIFRSLVSCAGGLDLEPLDERSYLVTLAEDGKQTNVRMVGAGELAHLSDCLTAVRSDLSCP
jgi:hypothetical protein